MLVLLTARSENGSETAECPALGYKCGGALVPTAYEVARNEGFARLELMATLAGAPLYRTCGCEIVEQVSDNRGGVRVSPTSDCAVN